MTEVVIKEFAQLFRQYLDLCLKAAWPEDDTEPEQVVRALEVAHHVEQSVMKMKSNKNCFDKFLELCTDPKFTHTALQNCLTDPPKSILKKIITSEAPVSLIDVALERFRYLYSEDRLVESLSELMVEAASKETLLKNMSTVLPAHKVQELTNHLHLFVILECGSQETFEDMLKDCCQDMMDALVLCLVKDDIKLKKDDLVLIRRNIITGFTNVMECRGISVKRFWQSLFNVDKDNLVSMLLKYKALREMTFEALGDSYNRMTMHSESYIELTESQCNMLFENETLKSEYMKLMSINGYSSCMPVPRS